DPVEQKYCLCYPPGLDEPAASCSALAREMIARRREKLTLDALRDLVIVLGGAREERKAVLAITQGWTLFRPNSALASMTNGRMPGVAPVGIDPKTGRLGTDTRNDPYGANLSQCDRDRVNLAQIDDETEFRALLGEANRTNTTFYPIDPRGLAVFDSGIGPDPPPRLDVDHARLRTRLETLRTLAENTDGIAVVDTNNLSGALARV